jgi:hypothetical protein
MIKDNPTSSHPTSKISVQLSEDNILLDLASDYQNKITEEKRKDKRL